MPKDSQFPATTTHPDTGEMMVLDTTQGSEVLNARLTRDVGIAEGGRQALERIKEKEREYGRIYVNPVTGYRARLNPQATEFAAAGGSAMTARERNGAGDAPNSDARATRRQELERELAALDAQ